MSRQVCLLSPPFLQVASPALPLLRALQHPGPPAHKQQPVPKVGTGVWEPQHQSSPTPVTDVRVPGSPLRQREAAGWPFKAFFFLSC